MTDEIKHECGIALVRLRKPLEYYQLKYGTWKYGLQKLYLLMEKQHNRGQDGAGIACIKFDLAPGHKFIERIRSNSGCRDMEDLLENLSPPLRRHRTVPLSVGVPELLDQCVQVGGLDSV